MFQDHRRFEHHNATRRYCRLGAGLRPSTLTLGRDRALRRLRTGPAPDVRVGGRSASGPLIDA